MSKCGCTDSSCSPRIQDPNTIISDLQGTPKTDFNEIGAKPLDEFYAENHANDKNEFIKCHPITIKFKTKADRRKGIFILGMRESTVVYIHPNGEFLVNGTEKNILDEVGIKYKVLGERSCKNH